MTTIATSKVPAFGSTRAIQTLTVTRPTLTGTITQARPSYWPSAEILRFIFRGLTLSKKDEIIDALIAETGKSLNINDTTNSLIWHGIVTSELSVNQITPRRTADGSCADATDELYEISFTFRGELI